LQFDLLTLPFIGGYVFYTHFSLTAYSAVRAVGHHLLLRSALCGFVLLLMSRMLLLAAPQVEKHSDQFLAVAMSFVPALGLIGGVSLFECVWSEFKRKASSLLKSPKGVLLLLESAALLVIGAMTARNAPSSRAWLLSGSGATLLVAIFAWTVSTYTSIRFRLAAFRVSWFVLIFVLVVAVSADSADEINHMWEQFSPVHDSGAPTVALILGVSGWYPMNLLIPYKTGLERFHRLGNSDAMDRFLFDSAESNAFIQVTLSDGKFYVGKVESLAANPLAPNSFVRILPYASGYRDKDTKELKFTSFYETVYDELVKEPGFSESALDQFKKVLPFSAIFSANRFDPDMYIRFQRETAEADTASAKSKTDADEIGEG
jgi:hypothetical protein